MVLPNHNKNGISSNSNSPRRRKITQQHSRLQTTLFVTIFLLAALLIALNELAQSRQLLDALLPSSLLSLSDNKNDNHLEFFLGTSEDDMELFLKQSIINDQGKELVRFYQNNNEQENQPLRHLRFDHLTLPQLPPGTPVMTTAFLKSTVITQAPWFPYTKKCRDTCCAQAIAISRAQDATHIINSVDGQEVADVLLFGNNPPTHHEFAATELTADIIPCLRPGVIVHADSYRGPIHRFFEEHRPNMTVPYVLLTTKTDGSTPIHHFKDRLDTDPLLLAWYGINPKYKDKANHSKFRMMPLGLTGNAARQQPELDLLLQARNYSNPFGGVKDRWINETLWSSAVDTTPLLLVKFGINENSKHRQVPWDMGCNNRVMKPIEPVSCNLALPADPRQMYLAASKYLFGLSPPGNGLDCYRTYELLLNGVIPIVKAQPEYDRLFQDLPVMQLPHWNYTQQQLVDLMYQYVHNDAFLDNTFDKGWERLFLHYWRSKVLKDAQRENEIVKDHEGNEYYTVWHYTRHKPPYVEHAIPEHVAERERKKREQQQQQQQQQKQQQ